MKFHFALLLSASLSAQVASASEICSIERVSDPGVSARAKFITFPDGRVITVVGHNHGDRAFPQDLYDILGESKTVEERQGFAKRLSELMNGTDPTLTQQEADLIFLRGLLSSQSSTGFVAIEATPRTLESNQSFFDKLAKRLKKTTENTDILPSLQHRRSLLLSMGASYFLKSTEPKLFEKRALIGVESEAALKVERLASDNAANAFGQLMESAGDDRRLKMDIFKYRMKFEKMMFSEPENLNEQEQVDVLKSSWPSSVHAAAEEWIRGEFATIRALSGRDKEATKAMVLRRQSGIYFVGAYHLNSLMTELKTKCRFEAALQK